MRDYDAQVVGDVRLIRCEFRRISFVKSTWWPMTYSRNNLKNKSKEIKNNEETTSTSPLTYTWTLMTSIGLFFSFIAMQLVAAISGMGNTLTECFESFIILRYTVTTRRIHAPKHQRPLQFTPSIAFMGGGQLWMFSIGAGHYIYENYDIEKIKFLASSCGCFAAVPLACGLDP